MLTHKSPLFVLTFVSLFCICCCAPSPPGSIQLNQQLLLSRLDATSAASQPFLTSPSGIYAANLVRTQADSRDSSCYILVQGKGRGGRGGGANIIGCGRISGAQVCNLVFSTTGLGILDGMNPTWNASISTGAPATDLVLLDSGELVILDSSEKIAWTASESRTVADRNCESNFSPIGISSEESQLGRAPPSEQQNPVMGNFEQQQPQGRHSGILGFDYKQPLGGDDQQGNIDEVGDGFENGVSGIKGVEIIGGVIVTTFIYLIIVV